MKRQLANFQKDKSYRLTPRLFFWWIVHNTIFISPFFGSRLRVRVLRFFGAEIGEGVLIRARTRIHFPWNLKIGNDCWIGEDVWFINHEVIDIGSNVCVSQSVVICSSSHDFRTSSLDYKHGGIQICDGAWICLRATILAGGKVGINSVVSAGEVFAGDLKDEHIFVNGLEKPIGYVD